MDSYSRAVQRRAKLHDAYLDEFDRALAWAKLPTNKGNVCAQWGTDGAEGEPAEAASGGDSALQAKPGALAEWLRSGLQSRLHRFDSGGRLLVSNTIWAGSANLHVGNTLFPHMTVNLA